MRKQACKTQIPPHGLTRRRHPQFPMSTDPRRRCPTIRTRRVTTGPTGPNYICRRLRDSPRAKVHQEGRRKFIKGEKTCPDSRQHPCKISRPCLFRPLRNPSPYIQTKNTKNNKQKMHSKQSIPKQTNKQVRQQACKTHTPPYGLKQRRRPQFPMPMPCTEADLPPEPFIPEVMPPP